MKNLFRRIIFIFLKLIIFISQGHTKPVTAVTFSGDGHLIVSCSLEEGTVRVWNPNPGLFGMIAGSLTSSNGGSTNAKGFKTPLSSSIKTSKTFNFNLGEDGKFINYLYIIITTYIIFLMEHNLI